MVKICVCGSFRIGLKKETVRQYKNNSQWKAPNKWDKIILSVGIVMEEMFCSVLSYKHDFGE